MARELLMNEGPKRMVNAEGTVKVHISQFLTEFRSLEIGLHLLKLQIFIFKTIF